MVTTRLIGASDTVGPRATIVPVGDSITANMSSNSPGVAIIYSNLGILTWANMLAGAPFDIPYIAGNPTDTSTQIAALFASQVVPYHPSAITLMMGTNDPSGTSATTIANYKSIYQQCAANGIYIFDLAILPRPTTGAQSQADIINVNWWRQQWWRNHTGGEYIDLFTTIIDPTSTSQAVLANTLDGNVHPTNYGAQLMGAVLATRLAAIGKPSFLTGSAEDDVNVNSASLQQVRNPMLLGSGGNGGTGITGTIAQYWQVYAISGSPTAVCSVTARGDGIGNNQVAVITAGANADQVEIQPYYVYNPSLIAGITYYMDASIAVSASPTNLKSVEWVINGVSGVLGDNGLPSGRNINGFNGTYRSPYFTVASNAQYQPRLVFTFSGAGSATVSIGRVGLRQYAYP